MVHCAINLQQGTSFTFSYCRAPEQEVPSQGSKSYFLSFISISLSNINKVYPYGISYIVRKRHTFVGSCERNISETALKVDLCFLVFKSKVFSNMTESGRLLCAFLLAFSIIILTVDAEGRLLPFC